jgi:mono/diheme cytochrome c family protein
MRRWTLIGCGLVLLLLILAGAGALLGPRWLADLTSSPEVAADANTAALIAQRLRETEQLNSYGWVDEPAEVAHIPIEQAIALIADAGLPVGVTPVPTDAVTATESVTSETAAETVAAPVDLANVSFQANVLPIFEQHCVECHGDERSEEGLKLVRYRTVMGGSQNGPVVVAGDPDGSYLLEMIVSGKMPKEGPPLSDTEIEIIHAWIEAGAQEN